MLTSRYSARTVRLLRDGSSRFEVIQVPALTTEDTLDILGPVPLPEAQFSAGTAVFIGNEGAGIDKKLLGEMDELIMIPHSPRVESLNAGVAASIVLYEAARQRT